jgi:hypothetical protein
VIEPEIKNEIRNHVVKANLALHRSETEELTRQLREALAAAERIKQQQQPGREQTKLF